MNARTASALPLAFSAHLALVIGAAIGMASGFAILFGGTFGLFVKPIGAALGWDRSQVSLILTMGYLGYSLGSPVVGALYDRFGIPLVQGTAIVVFASSLASLAWLPPTLPALLSAALVIGLSGAATAPSGYVLILTKSIRTRLGLAVGLAMLGLGLGLSFAPALAQASITHFGWRGAYLAFGAGALIAGLMALLLITAARSRAQTGGMQRPAVAAATGATLRGALCQWRFWLLGATSLAVGAVGFGILAHLPAALSDRGVAQGDVVRIAGLMGLGILIGRVGAAVAMDRFFAPVVALVCYAIGGLGLYGLAVIPADQVLLLQLAAIAAGLLTGSEGDVMPFLTRHYFGLARFGAIFGCVIGLAGFGGLLGPVLFGYAFVATGSYAVALHAGMVVCLASGVSLLAMGPYRYSFKPGEGAHTAR